jgi:hypothetical protein
MNAGKPQSADGASREHATSLMRYASSMLNTGDVLRDAKGSGE